MKGKTPRLVLLFVAVAAIILFILLGANSLSLQRSAKIALEDFTDSGRELPVGEYVSYEARVVLGPFAYKSTTSFFNSMKLNAAETGYFYFLLLGDGTLMAINTANDEEKAAFDRISERLLASDEVTTDGETVRINGRLKEFKDEELREIYRSEIGNVFGISPDDPGVRYLILDTTAGREHVFYIGFAALVALIAGFIIAGQHKGKRKAVPME